MSNKNKNNEYNVKSMRKAAFSSNGKKVKTPKQQQPQNNALIFSELKFSNEEKKPTNQPTSKTIVKLGFMEKKIRFFFRKTYNKIYERGVIDSMGFDDSLLKPLKSSSKKKQKETNKKDVDGFLEKNKDVLKRVEKEFINNETKTLKNKKISIDDKIESKSANDRFAKSGHLEETNSKIKSKSANDRFAKSGHEEDEIINND